MEVSEFEELLERLTGTSVKELSEADRRFLKEALRDEAREIDASQLNELLLLANKDRVEAAFFKFFFAPEAEQPNIREEAGLEGSRRTCTVAGLRVGVERFQRFALLSFGNFIYAFRLLSRASTGHELRDKIGEPCDDPVARERALKERPSKVLEVTPILREQTYLVGYLSVREITADQVRAELLEKIVDKTDESGGKLQALLENDEKMQQTERDGLLQIVKKLRVLASEDETKTVPSSIAAAKKLLDAKLSEMLAVQTTAQRNTDVYLTWDHMDIYFATSMRKRREYEDLHDFVGKLMDNARLKELRLRYFDPTQSYDENRINKGLVEALMLKRAAVTVYSVQDTDTLGKDSELAATLAQGKPVVAYAPVIDGPIRTAELLEQGPQDLRDRLQFVLNADEISRASLREPVVTQFLDACIEYDQRAPWRALSDDEAWHAFRSKTPDVLARLCEFVAAGESRISESRARTLRDSHPLGIQVNLETGVANGVLVVRSIAECAELIANIITNRMEFDVQNDQRLRAWVLRERISGSIYRVVTQNMKLTNCFWNFYRRPLTPVGT